MSDVFGKFEIGQVVMLNSGGPCMTVVSRGVGRVKCRWSDRRGRLFKGAFPEVCVQLYQLAPEEISAGPTRWGTAGVV